MSNIVLRSNANGEPTISSTFVAELFELRHDNLVRDIEDIICDSFDDRQFDSSLTEESNCAVSVYAPYFKLSEYEDSRGKSQKCFDITQTGFLSLMATKRAKRYKALKAEVILAFSEQIKRREEVIRALRTEMKELQSVSNHMGKMVVILRRASGVFIATGMK